MIKKIICLLIGVSLIGFIVPVTDSTPLNSPETTLSLPLNGQSSLLSHVVAKGNGSTFSFLGSFIFGIGGCTGMVVLLEEDGYIEITPLDDPTNSTILEGKHQLFIFGFFGLRLNIPQVTVNGLGLLVLWT
jgi:hypothetical protein